MLYTACGESNPESARFAGGVRRRSAGRSPVPPAVPPTPQTTGSATPAGAPWAWCSPPPPGSRCPPVNGKQVTVLFADVVGSIDLGGGMDAEEWRELMERFFAVLRDGSTVSGAGSTSSPATGSWRSSGRPVA